MEEGSTAQTTTKKVKRQHLIIHLPHTFTLKGG